MRSKRLSQRLVAEDDALFIIDGEDDTAVAGDLAAREMDVVDAMAGEVASAAESQLRQSLSFVSG